MKYKVNAFLLSLGLLFGVVFVSCQFKQSEGSKIDTMPEYLHYKDWEFRSVAIDDTIKMAYADLGLIDSPIVVLLHGEPSSSFVYRNIAPSLVKDGFRVIVPDLIGFGHSDKPVDPEYYTYSNHTKWLSNFFKVLDLNDVNLYAHDWGAMLSLRIVAEQPERFAKVAISYGYLFEGNETIPESFNGFKNYAKNDPNFSAGNIMNWGSNIELPDSIKALYDEPLRESNFVAAKRFPWLIPDNPTLKEGMLNQDLNQKLKQFDNPFVTIWGNTNDSMWVGKDVLLQENVRGAKNQKHFVLDSNHFIQEDQPVKLTEILVSIFK